MDMDNNIKINNNDEDNSSHGDNKGKFSDRLKKMRRDRLKRKKHAFVEEDELSVITFGRNVLKVCLSLPTMVYTHVVAPKKDNILDKVDKMDKVHEVNNNRAVNTNDKRVKINKIKNINVSLLKKKRELYSKSFADLSKQELTKEVVKANEEKLRIAKLQKEILALIKKKLIKNVNELEILHSELYVLRELTGDDVYLDECQQNVKEIRKLLSKIKALKEKYDYLKDNVDFEYMLEYGDDILIDKILELKDLCSKEDIIYVVDNYKLLDEYKYLYLKIDKLQEDSIKFEEYKNKKAEELKERDIDFDKLKNEVFDIDREKERYDRFVKEQEILLRSLDSKVSQIDSHEQVTYRLKGFNQLLGNSFKYLGLLLLNPLKGLIPGIATQTLVTKNIVRNLYDNLEVQENRKMIYDAIDYSVSIRVAINNLDDTSNLVNATLDDIVRLKAKYKEQFSKYEGSIHGYKDAISKINKIENAVLGTKVKIESVKTKMKEKERQNDIKMKRVKKLNDATNS